MFAEEVPQATTFEVPIPLKPQIAEASSTQPPVKEKGENFDVKNLIDGNPATRWSSDFKEPQWVVLDLGGVFDINKIIISWETAYAVSYRIEASTDKKSWNEAYSTEAGKGNVEIITFPAQKARYIKINCLKRKGEWGFSIWDITVYGKRKLVLF